MFMKLKNSLTLRKNLKFVLLLSTFLLVSCTETPEEIVDQSAENTAAKCETLSALNPIDIELNCKPIEKPKEPEKQFMPVTLKLVNEFLLEMDCATENIKYGWQANWCNGIKSWEDYNNNDEINKDDYVKLWQLILLMQFDKLNQKLFAQIFEKSQQELSVHESKAFTNILYNFYNNVGIQNYNCTRENLTLYQQRWCTAAKSYQESDMYKKGDLLVRQYYINGYFVGESLALSSPNSIENLLTDQGKPDIQINNVAGKSSSADNYFISGYHAGFAETAEELKSTVSKALEDLDLPTDGTFQLPTQ